ncbi:hypothetical protein LFREDSHE_23740 [Shewanella baltica]
MCGRISIDSFLANTVSLQLGVPFNPQTNLDLRPTEQVSVIMMSYNQLQQLDCTWGIKPAWSKKLLINAQAETVREKKSLLPHLRVIAALRPALVGMNGARKKTKTEISV